MLILDFAYKTHTYIRNPTQIPGNMSPVTDTPVIFGDEYTTMYNTLTLVCTLYLNRKWEKPRAKLVLRLENSLEYTVN